MNERNWTPGQWRGFNAANRHIGAGPDGKVPVADTVRWQDAERIVQCVNACREGGPVQALCEAATKFGEYVSEHCIDDSDLGGEDTVDEELTSLWLALAAVEQVLGRRE